VASPQLIDYAWGESRDSRVFCCCRFLSLAEFGGYLALAAELVARQHWLALASVLSRWLRS
jgi:hypothetical protein